jgi:hypothetical protein
MSDIDTGSNKPISDLSIGEIVRELADIDEKLETLPADDFATRVDLRQRHLDLKARAAQLNADADEQRSTEDLMTEIQSLNQRITEIQGEFVDTSEQDGEGNISGPYQAQRGPSEMNQEIADAHGAPEMVARRDKLEWIVRGRGIEPNGSASGDE